MLCTRRCLFFLEGCPDDDDGPALAGAGRGDAQHLRRGVPLPRTTDAHHHRAVIDRPTARHPARGPRRRRPQRRGLGAAAGLEPASDIPDDNDLVGKYPRDPKLGSSTPPSSAPPI